MEAIDFVINTHKRFIGDIDYRLKDDYNKSYLDYIYEYDMPINNTDIKFLKEETKHMCKNCIDKSFSHCFLFGEKDKKEETSDEMSDEIKDANNETNNKKKTMRKKRRKEKRCKVCDNIIEYDYVINKNIVKQYNELLTTNDYNRIMYISRDEQETFIKHIHSNGLFKTHKDKMIKEIKDEVYNTNDSKDELYKYSFVIYLFNRYYDFCKIKNESDKEIMEELIDTIDIDVIVNSEELNGWFMSKNDNIICDIIKDKEEKGKKEKMRKEALKMFMLLTPEQQMKVMELINKNLI